ncbi:hypothetical protein TNCV_3395921 [Trichonephila clavipes]|nr:hypothetical protein TNCV_3395921 [Trichonephila clavipes]
MRVRLRHGNLWPIRSGGGSIVTSGPKVVTRIWNQFQADGTVTRRVSQGHHRASTSAQNCYLALSPQRRRLTVAPQLSRDLAAVSGRRISRKMVYSCLAEIGL